MKSNEDIRTLTTSGVAASADFGLSFEDEVHIMSILRDSMYSDKVLAVLREYSANAWDSHRMSGIPDRPISVTLPTRLAPTLTIRDYGTGLSHEDVFTVFNKYGASTKRGSNEAVGMLGIGSKSAFAYADSFTLTSWFGCTKRVYIAVLDESGRGGINLVHEEPCGERETGIEIQIAVKLEDISEFTEKAQDLFQHFRPRPLINTELPPAPSEETVLSNGSIVPAGRDAGGEWVAIMGCVPYNVKLDQLPEDRLNACLHSLSGTVKFEINEVHISASREELKYSTKTKEALIAKFDALIDEYVTQALNLVETATITEWDKRLRMIVLDNLNLPIPEAYESYTKIHVKVFDPGVAPGTFSIVHNKSAVSSVTVTPDLRLLIDDTGKNLKGYALTVDDYIVRPLKKKTTATELRALLDDALAAAKLTGVKIELLSTLPWELTGRNASRVANPKAKIQTFVFNEIRRYHKSPYNESWQAVDRVPEDGDVFVVIEGYKAIGYKLFFEEYNEDKRLAKAFGLTMPPVYGYKTSVKKPVYASSCKGTEYREWRKNLVVNLMTPELRELVGDWYWRQSLNQSFHGSPKAKTRNALAKVLGDEHPIITLLDRAIAVDAKLKPYDEDVLRHLIRRSEIVNDQKLVVTATLEEINQRYPLLRHGRGPASLWGGSQYGYGGYDVDPEEKAEAKEWLAYVQMVDIANPLPTISTATTNLKKAG